MIEVHFNLAKTPFSGKNSLYPSDDYEELKTRLSYSYSLNGVILVSGESGSGKSFTTNKLLKTLPMGFKVVNLHALSSNTFNLFYDLAQKFNLDSKSTSRGSLTIASVADYIIRHYHATRENMVIVIDGAQILSLDNYNALNSFLDIIGKSGAIVLLVIITSNLHELKNPLNLIKDQILVNYIFSGLSSVTEVETYCKNEITNCKGNVNIIDESCYKILFEKCKGNYRIINKVMINSLAFAYLDKSDKVTQQHVINAITELDVT